MLLKLIGIHFFVLKINSRNYALYKRIERRENIKMSFIKT